MNIRNALLGLIGSVALGVVAIQADQSLSETILLNDEVDTKSITNILTELTNDGNLLGKMKKVRLIINSPGGMVDQLELLTRIAPTLGRHITTEVPAFAASAAADIFVLGNERLMHKKASILFHEVRIFVGGNFFESGYPVTVTDLLSYLKTGKLADNSPMKHKEEYILNILNGLPKELVEKVTKMMEESNNDHIKYLSERLNVTEEFVRENLVVPNVDVILNLEQALALGVATGELK